MFILCRLILIIFVAMCFCCTWLAGATYGGPIAALIVFGVVAIAAKRGRFFTAFGTARWATDEHLRGAGMLNGQGLVVGTLLASSRPRLLAATLGLINPLVNSADATNHFLRAIFPNLDVNPSLVRLSRAVHTAVFAPTGAGKGVSCVLPFLLTCLASLVCTDFKGELAILTAEHRRRMGQRVVLLDPWHLVTNTPDTFNPLDFIDKDSPNALDDIRDLAEALVIATGKETDPHWNESSKIEIVGVTAAVVRYGDPDDRSLQTVRNVIANPEKLDQVCKLNQGSDAWDGMLARLGWQMSNYKDKEAASVMTTANRHLSFLDTPAVAASTRSSTFDPAELRTGKMTIYLVIPLEHSEAGLLRMWVGSMLRAVIRGGTQA